MLLTVSFDGRFYVGILEWTSEDGLCVKRHVFGEEPAVEEVYDFVLTRLNAMFRGTDATYNAEPSGERKLNPKRMMRETARAINAYSISTKAQEALRVQMEENKLQKKTISREQKIAELERKREIRNAKKKAKHRGH